MEVIRIVYVYTKEWHLGMGIDKNFTIPVPSPILLIDPIPFRFSYRFFLGEK